MNLGDELFHTISLRLVNFLTCEKGIRIVKVKRDFKNSYVVYFYFQKTDELMQAVEEFKSTFKTLPPEEYILERLSEATNGVWRTVDNERRE